MVWIGKISIVSQLDVDAEKRNSFSCQNRILSQKMFVDTLPKITDVHAAEDKKLMFLASALCKYRGLMSVDAKKKPVMLVKQVIFNSLKVSRLSDDV